MPREGGHPALRDGLKRLRCWIIRLRMLTTVMMLSACDKIEQSE
jgi:hypothetical protein